MKLQEQSILKKKLVAILIKILINLVNLTNNNLRPGYFKSNKS